MLDFKENISLLAHNTFGVDVKCKYFIEYSSTGELKKILLSDVFLQHDFLHIGAGSNLLFLSDYQGLILHSQIKYIKKTEEDAASAYFKIGAGVVWDDFVRYAVENNYYGIENLSYIPGEVGAAAVQNIGAYGVEVKDTLVSVEVLNIQTKKTEILTNTDCQFAYRDSLFKKKPTQYIVTAVNFKLAKTPQFHLEYANLRANFSSEEAISLSAVRDLIIQIREKKLPDPQVIGNAGSFFKNPIISIEKFQALQLSYPSMPFYSLNDSEVKIPAAWLIDSCAWKEKGEQGVGVYEKQPLVIINKGNASGKDIYAFSLKIIKSVQEKFDILIEPEVLII